VAILRKSLAKGVGEVTETLEGLGCSMVERSKGLKFRTTWNAYENLGVQDFRRSSA